MIRADIFKSKWVVVLLLVTGLILGSSGLTSAASKGPIKVGLMVPLTGFAVEDGKQYSRGVNLAFDEINWNMTGRKIDLVTEDYAYNPTVAVQKIKKLFYNDKIKLVIGPFGDGRLRGYPPLYSGKQDIEYRPYGNDGQVE